MSQVFWVLSFFLCFFFYRDTDLTKIRVWSHWSGLDKKWCIDFLYLWSNIFCDVFITESIERRANFLNQEANLLQISSELVIWSQSDPLIPAPSGPIGTAFNTPTGQREVTQWRMWRRLTERDTKWILPKRFPILPRNASAADFSHWLNNIKLGTEFIARSRIDNLIDISMKSRYSSSSDSVHLRLCVYVYGFTFNYIRKMINWLG